MENYREVCVVSVAFREPYVTHSRKQEAIILAENETWEWISRLYFIDRLPTKNGIITENIVTEFQKSLYGFKPHAIQHAIDSGYKKIIWLDPALLPVTSVQVLINSLDINPIIVRIGDTPLAKMCNQKAKDWFGITDDDIQDVKHIGGTIYGFNFNNSKAIDVFNLWKKAEEEGIFGTQDEFMAGHWADEACMALSLHKCGMPQYWEENFLYLNQKDL